MEGKIRVVEIRPVERNSVLAVEINDTTGNLTAMFYGRSHIPGLICGAKVRFTGSVAAQGRPAGHDQPATSWSHRARRGSAAGRLTPSLASSS